MGSEREALAGIVALLDEWNEHFARDRPDWQVRWKAAVDTARRALAGREGAEDATARRNARLNHLLHHWPHVLAYIRGDTDVLPPEPPEFPPRSAEPAGAPLPVLIEQEPWRSIREANLKHGVFSPEAFAESAGLDPAKVREAFDRAFPAVACHESDAEGSMCALPLGHDGTHTDREGEWKGRAAKGER